MIEQKGYLKIGNMYLQDMRLSFNCVSNDFIDNILFTSDIRNARMISFDIFDDLRKKLYINLNIKYEDIMFIEKEN